MKQIISILLILSILFSCKKSSTTEEENYRIEGLALDYDSKTAVPGAKVYLYEFCCANTYVDSAISDGNGRVSFICKKEGKYKLLTAVKDNYVHPQKYGYILLDHIGRTDTVYLGRPSFLQLTVHKTGIYQPMDSVLLSVSGDYTSSTSGHTYNYRTLVMDKADAPDKVFNLYTFYESVNYDKLTFHCLVTRNGNVVFDQYISTNLIQFGTKNFTLNY